MSLAFCRNSAKALENRAKRSFSLSVPEREIKGASSARALSAEVTLENALNRQFYTAFTPTPNIGAPRLWRVGLRWDGRVR